MAETITYDYLNGGISAKLTSEGWEYTITHIIRGIQTGANIAERMYNAIVFAGFEIGEDIGSWAEGCWLRSQEITLMGGEEKENENFQLTLQYKENPRQTLKIDSGSTLQQLETNKDFLGNSITTTYTYPTSYPDAALAGKEVTQGGIINFLQPQRTVTYRLREMVDPAIPAALYEGKINSNVWRGQDVGTWLCTGITGFSDNSGSFGYFDNSYTFQNNPQGWNVIVNFKQSDGLPPADIDDYPAASVEVEPYDYIDFNTLFNTI